MARPGPKEKHSTERMLFEILVSPDNKAFAKQIWKKTEYETEQGARDRLNKIADQTNYIEVDVVSGVNLYSLTSEGRNHLLRVARERLDDD